MNVKNSHDFYGPIFLIRERSKSEIWGQENTEKINQVMVGQIFKGLIGFDLISVGCQRALARGVKKFIRPSLDVREATTYSHFENFIY